MENKDKLNKINNELKVYINEANFISIKCREKLLRILSEEFDVNLDLNSYANVDVHIELDGKISYRGDLYEPDSKIDDFSQIEEKYNNFKEKADKLLSKKEIDFKNKSNVNNITNLVIVVCILILIISIIILVIFALLSGNYFDCLWLLFVIVPAVVPRFKESIHNRFIQARNYLKHLFKKIK